VRHALVPIQLIQGARAANRAALPERQLEDAPPDPAPAPQPHRLATLFRRARARTHGLRAESPGGGA
jgi:hypothetical protein